MLLHVKRVLISEEDDDDDDRPSLVNGIEWLDGCKLSRIINEASNPASQPVSQLAGQKMTLAGRQLEKLFPFFNVVYQKREAGLWDERASERESGPISLLASWNQISRTKGTDDNDDADYNDRGSEWEEWWKKWKKWKLKGVENKWEENWASNEEEDRMCVFVCCNQEIGDGTFM